MPNTVKVRKTITAMACRKQKRGARQERAGGWGSRGESHRDLGIGRKGGKGWQCALFQVLP